MNTTFTSAFAVSLHWHSMPLKQSGLLRRDGPIRDKQTVFFNLLVGTIFFSKRARSLVFWG